jgi:hypothetical protein
MHRDMPISLGTPRDTLEYAEARTVLAQKAVLKRHLRNLNVELKLLRHLSPEAVHLAKADAGEEQKDSSA